MSFFLVITAFLYLRSSLSLVITSPCCDVFDHRVSAFGPGLPVEDEHLIKNRVVLDSVEGRLILAYTDLCEDFVYEDYNDTIVAVARGGCSFVTKVDNAEAAGAIAVIVYESNENLEGLVTMSAAPLSPEVKIPSVFVDYDTGVLLEDILLNGTDSEYAVLNATGSVAYDSDIAFDIPDVVFIVILSTLGLFCALLLLVLCSCCLCSKQSVQSQELTSEPDLYTGPEISGTNNGPIVSSYTPGIDYTSYQNYSSPMPPSAYRKEL